ncbi:Glycerol kinase [Wickerhamomyces ciferrii]|uniref:glycerol kinase n=1 Tax=Wickerhamomyces ciferrii (strain ATCC 14091 / BCRC 22168 / CBS 111 / JCM 3599 / NBRC 0793 / NRRL Y-1031 F-60-10) TaxID=1206466 RepID=K0KQT7_WICCF|nr:Glycerol kinase [Wickerhamomyces ciferrii]CCH44492.1 Glycerol kinase [Wickerhamomyces ciferrii]
MTIDENIAASTAKEFKVLVSIDIGTTSTRVILFDRYGKDVASHQIEYSTSANTTLDGQQKIYSAEGTEISANYNLEIEGDETKDGPTLKYPGDGKIEIIPTHIISNVVACFAHCIIKLNEINDERRVKSQHPYIVAAIGIANMRETTILWDSETGEAVYDGLVWSDARTSEIVQNMKETTPKEKLDAIQQKCGLNISTYFSASKIRWLIDNVPNVQQSYQAGKLMFGTVDTWLIYHLTKGRTFATDVTNASRTMFMDINTLQYDSELFEFWNIDPNLLKFPEIKSSSEFYGNFELPNLKAIGAPDILTKEGKLALQALGNTVPINGVIGDQCASMVGQLAFKKGSAKATYGTGCFLMLNTGYKPLISKNGLVTTVGFWFKNMNQDDDSIAFYAIEGSIAVAGSCIQWLRDNLNIILRAQDVGPLASSVKNSGGVIFLPAFTGFFAPYWDQYAQGTIFGISQSVNFKHIARAALEGICFQVRAILKAMCQDAGGDSNFLDGDKPSGKQLISELAIDGGISKSKEFNQIQSDILGPCMKLYKSQVSEATALGAAIAAGCGFEKDDEKVWASFKEVKDCMNFKNSEVYESKMDKETRKEICRKWEKAVSQAGGWLSNGVRSALTEEEMARTSIKELERRIDLLQKHVDKRKNIAKDAEDAGKGTKRRC